MLGKCKGPSSRAVGLVELGNLTIRVTVRARLGKASLLLDFMKTCPTEAAILGREAGTDRCVSGGLSGEGNKAESAGISCRWL